MDRAKARMCEATGLRTKKLPKTIADLMPRSAFCFQRLMRDNKPSRIMISVDPTTTTTTETTTAAPTRPSIRISADNSNHHLWNNHGTWFVHYTIHPTPLTKERIRRSLGTKDLSTARRRRDRCFAGLYAGTFRGS